MPMHTHDGLIIQPPQCRTPLLLLLAQRRYRLPTSTPAAAKAGAITSGSDCDHCTRGHSLADQKPTQSRATIAARIFHPTGDAEIPIAPAASSAPPLAGSFPGGFRTNALRRF